MPPIRGTDISVEPGFDRFVRQHARPVLAYCLRRSSRADAHEAAAEVFAVAWRRFEDVPDGDAARFWLFGVARRVLANQRRAQQRRSRLTRRIASFAAAPVPGPETIVVRNAEDQQVVEALQTLHVHDQEVLALIVWDEVPRARVAALLGVSEQAVHKRYQRALGRLEAVLAREGGHPTTPHRVVEEGGAT